MMSVGIITVSDRAFHGQYDDASGPALKRFCAQRGWSVTGPVVVPDEAAAISAKTVELAKSCPLVVLTGGTGIAERDVTPEAVRAVASKELPGFGELMRLRSLERSPHAILSRGLAAVVGRSLVICLPGSPRGAVECLDFVADAIPHALELLRGETRHK
jgi:molybdopterin adenylyltransferase